jgi:hypothetical protein
MFRAAFASLVVVGVFGPSCRSAPPREEPAANAPVGSASSLVAAPTASVEAPAVAADQLAILGQIPSGEEADPAKRLARAVQKVMASEARACIKTQPDEHKAMKGTLEVVLGADGSVATARSEGLPRWMGTCLEAAMKKQRFERPAADQKPFVLPLNIAYQ